MRASAPAEGYGANRPGLDGSELGVAGPACERAPASRWAGGVAAQEGARRTVGCDSLDPWMRSNADAISAAKKAEMNFPFRCGSTQEFEQWPMMPIFGDAFRPSLVDTRNGPTISAGTTLHTTTKRPELHV